MVPYRESNDRIIYPVMDDTSEIELEEGCEMNRMYAHLAAREVREHVDTLQTDSKLVTLGRMEKLGKNGTEGRLDILPPATAYVHFTLGNLRYLDLPQDTSEKCDICSDVYSKEDPAVQIRNVPGCNHVFGRKCLGLFHVSG
jgi:hypothetical protein